MISSFSYKYQDFSISLKLSWLAKINNMIYWKFYLYFVNCSLTKIFKIFSISFFYIAFKFNFSISHFNHYQNFYDKFIVRDVRLCRLLNQFPKEFAPSLLILFSQNGINELTNLLKIKYIYINKIENFCIYYILY